MLYTFGVLFIILVPDLKFTVFVPRHHPDRGHVQAERPSYHVSIGIWFVPSSVAQDVPDCYVHNRTSESFLAGSEPILQTLDNWHFSHSHSNGPWTPWALQDPAWKHIQFHFGNGTFVAFDVQRICRYMSESQSATNFWLCGVLILVSLFVAWGTWIVIWFVAGGRIHSMNLGFMPSDDLLMVWTLAQGVSVCTSCVSAVAFHHVRSFSKSHLDHLLNPLGFVVEDTRADHYYVLYLSYIISLCLFFLAVATFFWRRVYMTKAEVIATRKASRQEWSEFGSEV
jgi:hypothetical protein